ncbi:MAG: hypothetical protein N2558_04665 [Patescibacteria group bacterium]|nr:hypothetical protein [Patescibacteria group bacterium]
MNETHSQTVIDSYLSNLSNEKISIFLDLNSYATNSKIRMKKLDRLYLRLKKKALKDCGPLFLVKDLIENYYNDEVPKRLCDLTKFIDYIKQRIFDEIRFHEHFAFERIKFFEKPLKIKKEDRNCYIGEIIKKYQIPEKLVSFAFFENCVEVEK